MTFDSEQVLGDLSNNLPAAIFMYCLNNDGTDSVQYISSGCFSIWGVDAKCVMENAKILWDIVHPDDLEQMIHSVQESAKTMSKWECEWRITPYNSDKTKWLRGYGTPHSDNEGGIIWNSVILDVTAEKEAQTNEREALKHTINVLVSALEARDPYTAGHGKSVGGIAEKIAVELGLSPFQVEGISLGGLIHDVGKISTPSEILTKPTTLVNEEYALIKLHAETGGRFFEGVQLNWPIKEMVEQHHERLDGSGYPKGLIGEQIILEARIIAVADVIDSMATNRPYRFAPGLTALKETLTKGRGVKFDSEIVDIAIKLIDLNKLNLTI